MSALSVPGIRKRTAVPALEGLGSQAVPAKRLHLGSELGRIPAEAIYWAKLAACEGILPFPDGTTFALQEWDMNAGNDSIGIPQHCQF